jgi:hypothetical protein
LRRRGEPTEKTVAFQQNDLRSGASGGGRRGYSRRAPADDENVTIDGS